MSRCRTGLCILMALAVWGMFPSDNCIAGEDHVLKTSELHRALLDASRARGHDLAAIQAFFRSRPVAKILQNARMEPARIDQAVSLLDNQELARLASRTAKIQEDLAAGALTNLQLTYIVIALATAVIILVIVAR